MMVQLTPERHEVNAESQWVSGSGISLILSLKSSDPNGCLVSAKSMYLSMLHQLFGGRVEENSSLGKKVQALLSRAQALEHATSTSSYLKAFSFNPTFTTESKLVFSNRILLIRQDSGKHLKGTKLPIISSPRKNRERDFPRIYSSYRTMASNTVLCMA